MPNQCINSIGFIFNKSKIKVLNNHKQKYTKCNCNKCTKYINTSNICVMRLCKSDFISSSLAISTTWEEAWKDFNERIYSLLYAHFVISLGRHDTIHSIFAQLVRAVKSDCKNYIKLYFRYNFIPNLYNNSESQIIVCGDVPTSIPDNIPVSNNVSYNESDNEIYPEQCIQNSNSYYKLCNQTYYNLKFYYDDNYVFAPTFIDAATARCKPSNLNNCNLTNNSSSCTSYKSSSNSSYNSSSNSSCTTCKSSSNSSCTTCKSSYNSSSNSSCTTCKSSYNSSSNSSCTTCKSSSNSSSKTGCNSSSKTGCNSSSNYPLVTNWN